MGLFKGSLEKQAEKERKIHEQVEQLKTTYGITDTSPEDIANLRMISSALMGTNALQLGVALSSKVSPADRCMVDFLSAIISQNFMIIRELKKIDKEQN